MSLRKSIPRGNVCDDWKDSKYIGNLVHYNYNKYSAYALLSTSILLAHIDLTADTKISKNSNIIIGTALDQQIMIVTVYC